MRALIVTGHLRRQLPGFCYFRNQGLYENTWPLRERHGQFPEVPSFALVAESSYSEPTVDAAAEALARFEADTKHRDFKSFHFEQAIALKKRLAEQRGSGRGRS
jgi:hypothetical protein